MAEVPYGTWPSPLSPAVAVQGARELSEVSVDGGDVCWLEQRPEDEGRTTVVRRTADGAVADLSPAGADVRTRVHEYGGGPYLVAGGVLFFVDDDDQRLRRLDPGAAEPVLLTPEPPAPASVRYADLVLTPDGQHLVCVRETLHGPTAADAVDELVAVPASPGAGDAVVLAAGRDFYASPRLSRDGRQLAYVAWDHPAMPWDAATVELADLDGLVVTATRRVAGGDGESAILPEFSPDGVLHLVTDRTGWWNLHALEPDGSLHHLAPVEADLGQPPWELGQRLYGFLDDGRIAVVATDAGVERPGVLDPATGVLTPLSAHTACRSLTTGAGAVWCIAAAPTAFAEVVRGTPVAGMDVGSMDVQVVHRSRDLPVGAAYLPQPRAITFPTGGGEVAHALLYPPANPDVEAPAGERPPLIVVSHGGPTGVHPPVLDLEIAFFTSRGFAVVDVNYRGSSGFGRAYREALRGRWGVADVEDCAAAARYLVERGDVDGSRLVIRGGSAGGYTTLAALAFTDVFAAGASYYGVADPALLAEETHKLESRYLDGLIAPYPAERATYEERSPLHHADRITAPTILFQGLEDPVVPPSQAEAMVAALARGGVPHAYLPFPGEQHGFRRADNQVRCLEAELSFYAQVLGMPHPEDVPRVEVVRPRG